MNEESTRLQLQDSDNLGSPQAIVDDASIQKEMARNKESLKMKLLLRRPIGQLVEQGILPPLKASPVLYEQSKKLERARMEDFLKHKIQRRPDRQALIQQHILEDTTVSPSLQDKQRLLKKARLADDLNDRLSHRPGPLELIKGNILADDRLAQAIKEGQIQFKATCEGEVVKHPPPLFHIEETNDNSSDGACSPPQDSVASPSGQSMVSAFSMGAAESPVSSQSSSSTSLSLASPAPATSFLLSPATSVTSSPPQLPTQPLFVGAFCTLAPASKAQTTTVPATVASPFSPCSTSSMISGQSSTLSDIKPAFTPGTTAGSPRSESSFSKNRKKTKSKIQPKTRTIKFHEYKGPPSAQKHLHPLSDSESSYELLLKQQQLFLQWQLEWQQKYPQIILPVTQKPSDQMQMGSNAAAELSHKQNAQTIVFPSRAQTEPVAVSASPMGNHASNGLGNSQTQPTYSNNANENMSCMPGRVISKLEDMKVSDLKAELKKRSMPVSGSKPQLIERLKPFTEEVISGSRLGFASSTDVPVLVKSEIRMKEESVSVSSPEDHARSNAQTPLSMHSTPMEVDGNGLSHDNATGSPESAMDLTDNICLTNAVTLTTSLPTFTTSTAFGDAFIQNGEIVRLQQKRIEQLQKELEKSHFQLHFQHPIFQNQTQQITFPLASLAAPQIQFVSSPVQTHTGSGPDGGVDKNLQPTHTLFQNQGQQISIPLATLSAPQIQFVSNTLPSNASNNNSQAESEKQQTPKPSQSHSQSNGTSRQQTTAANASAAVKASLAAFLHNQAAQQQQNQVATSLPTIHATQLVNDNGKSPFQQMVLCPAPSPTLAPKSLAGTTPTVTTAKKPMSSRTNAILATNLSGNGNASEGDKSANKMRPPPNYEEATKVTPRVITKDRKKSIKSQAVDDVLEILIKNGELPPSAAQEPNTPTTPDKLRNSAFASHPQNGYVSLSRARSPLISVKIEDQQRTKESDKDITLDLDFTLDLQELADSMDFSALTNDHDQHHCLSGSGHRDSTGSDQTNDEMSLCELMDLRESPMSTDWISGFSANFPMPHERKHLPQQSVAKPSYDGTSSHHYDGLRLNVDNYNAKNVDQILGSDSNSQCGRRSDCSNGNSFGKDHDPVLPNNMVGTSSQGEQLIDLFFDESDLSKGTHDIVWDRLDFSS